MSPPWAEEEEEGRSDIARCLSAARGAGGRGEDSSEGCAEVGIVKITADVYAFMLSYCRRGFTDVYADLRFVLSAGTHCPRNYYSAVAAVAVSRRPRLLLLLLLHPRYFPPTNPLKSRISYAPWKILRPRCPYGLDNQRGADPRKYPAALSAILSDNYNLTR